jgi:predicted nucleic acid-binding protein
MQVVSELRRHDASWEQPDWLTIDVMTEPHVSEAAAWQAAGLLDLGEAEAIALARQVGADWLLTDDAAARLFASELNLEVHGSLGILLWSVAVGKLSHNDAVSGLDRLAASSLWISARVLAEAHRALDQMLDSLGWDEIST